MCDRPFWVEHAPTDIMRFVRKVWRKSRPQTGNADWPIWVKEQEKVFQLFQTMQRFDDDDEEYDAGKAWGIDEAYWQKCLFQTCVPYSSLFDRIPCP